MSLSELALKVGMAKSALSRYFNKTREFPLNRVDSFANALGVSAEYLLGLSEWYFGWNLQFYMRKSEKTRIE